MARIFTTSFVFNHKRYDTIVTVLSQEGELNFHIKMLNEEIRELLPNGELDVRGLKGFESLKENSNHHMQSFINSLASAIEKQVSI
jgi:hypothetical protein